MCADVNAYHILPPSVPSQETPSLPSPKFKSKCLHITNHIITSRLMVYKIWWVQHPIICHVPRHSRDLPRNYQAAYGAAKSMSHLFHALRLLRHFHNRHVTMDSLKWALNYCNVVPAHHLHHLILARRECTATVSFLSSWDFLRRYLLIPAG